MTTLLLAGCSNRIAEYSVVSTRNIDMKNENYLEGQRVVASDSSPVLLYPVGLPSIQEATNRAIDSDQCAVGLTNVTIDKEQFFFVFGYNAYHVEGNLLIDTRAEGCEFWPKSSHSVSVKK
ncbi:hypothetical protein N9R79_03815 [Vibrio sp.]|nr:hypothetical protein [Vibrio sp.]